MSSVIQGHNGRVVDAPGDNLLAEFAGALDAVTSAVEIQTTISAKNASLPDNQQMQFRIGINIGDVIHCLLYTSPSPRDGLLSRMPSSA